MQNQKLRLLSYIVMAYMLLAFTWWAMLLFTKNRDAFFAKQELMQIVMAAEGKIQDNQEFLQTDLYKELYSQYKRQEWMIFGEASVFVLTLVAGLWFIHKSYSRQVEANRQQRNFLLAITHELKSPIASIQLVLETLIKRDLAKPKADQLAGTALKENERLLQLVENLLLTAKLETAYQPNFEEVNLIELFQDLIVKAKGRHHKARINYSMSGTPPLMTLDRAGMTLLFNNLVDNAVKYSEGQPIINIGLDFNGHNASITFTDQGVGISNEDKKKVLEKFYRAGNEETRKTKGTGLGLFIVDQIVKAHNGHVNILDNQPQGTVFKIDLPNE
ncbi:MAG: HAMP domain-containing sensor histidine kinase [Bacteroidota bacterium]